LAIALVAGLCGMLDRGLRWAAGRRKGTLNRTKTAGRLTPDGIGGGRTNAMGGGRMLRRKHWIIRERGGRICEKPESQLAKKGIS